MEARSLNEQWAQCKEALREALDPDEAMAWLPGLRLAHLSHERAILAGVPNAFFHRRILRQFTPLLRRSLVGAFADWRLPEDLPLELRIGDGGPEARDGAEAPHPMRAGGTGALREEGGQMALPGLEALAEPAPEAAPARDLGTGFETFQVDPANRVAVALAREVAAEPGRHNPFVLVGGPGLGKSHLLAAIADTWAARYPDWRIVQRSGEGFLLDVLEGIRQRRMPAVRETYREADALLLDGLQQIEPSAKAQEELLHTLEALHGAGKPVVFAAGRPPTALLGLGDALRSRLEGSLVAELAPPGRESRLAILRAAAARAEIPLAEPELEYLAARISGSARRLEGALVRIGAYASMLKAPIDRAFVAEVAAPWLDAEPASQGHVPAAQVLAAVRAEFGLTERQLRSRDRARQVDLARQMAMRLLREQSGLAHGEIGRLLGNRAHSTVVEAIAALPHKLETRPAAAAHWARLRQRLAELARTR